MSRLLGVPSISYNRFSNTLKVWVEMEVIMGDKTPVEIALSFLNMGMTFALMALLMRYIKKRRR
ncbi:MAG: hypothetical protein ACK5MU_02085 [Candidatus Saccharimonadales bacterium]